MEKDKRKPQGFKKQQLLDSQRYEKNKDVLSALLQEGVSYTHKQVDDMLKNFYKKEVK